MFAARDEKICERIMSHCFNPFSNNWENLRLDVFDGLENLKSSFMSSNRFNCYYALYLIINAKKDDLNESDTNMILLFLIEEFKKISYVNILISTQLLILLEIFIFIIHKKISISRIFFVDPSLTLTLSNLEELTKNNHSVASYKIRNAKVLMAALKSPEQISDEELKHMRKIFNLMAHLAKAIIPPVAVGVASGGVAAIPAILAALAMAPTIKKDIKDIKKTKVIKCNLSDHELENIDAAPNENMVLYVEKKGNYHNPLGMFVMMHGFEQLTYLVLRSFNANELEILMKITLAFFKHFFTHFAHTYFGRNNANFNIMRDYWIYILSLIFFKSKNFNADPKIQALSEDLVSLYKWQKGIKFGNIDSIAEQAEISQAAIKKFHDRHLGIKALYC